MTHSVNLKKYFLIIRLLHNNNSKAPTLDYIQAHLQSHGFDNISARTLSRDFLALDTEFGISIEYDAQKLGYKNINASDEDLSYFNHFLKLLELAERHSYLKYQAEVYNIALTLLWKIEIDGFNKSIKILYKYNHLHSILLNIGKIRNHPCKINR